MSSTADTAEAEISTLISQGEIVFVTDVEDEFIDTVADALNADERIELTRVETSTGMHYIINQVPANDSN